MGDARLSASQKKELRDSESKKNAAQFAKKFRGLLQEAEHPGMRTKTQYPAYLQIGMLHIMKGVAEAEGISVQELIRQCLQEGLDKRMRTKPGGGKKSSAKAEA